MCVREHRYIIYKPKGLILIFVSELGEISCTLVVEYSLLFLIFISTKLDVGLFLVKIS